VRPAWPGSLLVGTAAMAPGVAIAQAGTTADPVLDSARLTEMVLGLALVVALILVLAWVLRRTLHLQPRGSSERMRVLAAHSLGARERVVLLQVGVRQLLLGVAPGRVHLLHVLDPAAEDTGFERAARAVAVEERAAGDRR